MVMPWNEFMGKRELIEEECRLYNTSSTLSGIGEKYQLLEIGYRHDTRTNMSYRFRGKRPSPSDIAQLSLDLKNKGYDLKKTTHPYKKTDFIVTGPKIDMFYFGVDTIDARGNVSVLVDFRVDDNQEMLSFLLGKIGDIFGFGESPNEKIINPPQTPPRTPVPKAFEDAFREDK